MSISIQTNVASLIAQNNLRVNSDFQSQTIQRLTSGYRINSSGDDAAGLAVANQFRSNIAELQQGVRNANDATSTLQIIDGGLSNISQTLDRLKTLATESASTTFTGNRTTLNNEFQSLLKEIDRQAANVGLNTGGKYNTSLSVYIGGGSNQANAQVSVNLSGSSNAVDTTGLGIANTTVQGGATALTGNTQRLDTPGATFASQSFTFNLYANGSAQSITVSSSAGSSQTAIDSLNNQLNQYGISAQQNSSTGLLEFGGGTAFSVSTTGAANKLTSAGAQTATNGANYEVDGAASYTAANENLTFQNGNGTTTVALTTTDTVDSALAKINAQTSSLGIFAVKNSAGTGISLQSATSFSASSDTASGTFTSSGAQTVNGPSAATNASALAAVAAINNAVQSLGVVQGKVGTGENQLQYAVNLAQSQISNFSAAQSRIRDADVASEAANLTKAQVLTQASIAAMAQANSAPQSVLKLLNG